ncbi:hypothetical protein N4R57_09730 [Rhodobacteraceae bacterium D3-12]|nr:hypothetical protein N4R57_09730 [Rhodobacteraceae bacterium D3-12]
MRSRVFQFVCDHWRGRLALLPSLLLTLLALRLLLDGATTARPVTWSLTATIAISLVSGAVLFWQLVGGVRAVARFGRDLFATAAGGLVVIITAMLFVNAELTHWAARGEIPVALPLPPKPYEVVNGVTRIDGPIDFVVLTRLELAIAAHPELTLLELQSDGGRIPAARAIAQRIEAAKLDTRAVGLCASACTLVFMAGQNRSLGQDGALGFHAYALLRNDNLQNARQEEARDRAYLSAKGITDRFMDRAYATPPDQLWTPTRDNLRAAGFLTEAGGL